MKCCDEIDILKQHSSIQYFSSSNPDTRTSIWAHITVTQTGFLTNSVLQAKGHIGLYHTFAMIWFIIYTSMVQWPNFHDNRTQSISILQVYPNFWAVWYEHETLKDIYLLHPISFVNSRLVYHSFLLPENLSSYNMLVGPTCNVDIRMVSENCS